MQESMKGVKYVVSGLIAILTFSPIIWAIITKDAVLAKIKGKHWVRTIDIERLQTFRRQGTWLPNGSRVIKSWTESYLVLVPESYTTGSGKNKQTRTRLTTETRTRTVYEYDIDEWVKVRTLNANGRAENPYWPNTSDLHQGGSVGCERPSYYYETYTIEVENKPNETYQYKKDIDVALKLWQVMPVDCPVVLEINKFGFVTDVCPMENP